MDIEEKNQVPEDFQQTSDDESSACEGSQETSCAVSQESECEDSDVTSEDIEDN